MLLLLVLLDKKRCMNSFQPMKQPFPSVTLTKTNSNDSIKMNNTVTNLFSEDNIENIEELPSEGVETRIVC